MTEFFNQFNKGAADGAADTLLFMSYDLAVWDGKQPADDREAGATHLHLYEQYIEADENIPPIPKIISFVEMLVKLWPDVDTDDDSPWAATPIISEARGPYIYFTMSWSRADEVLPCAAEIAEQLGLICFDPQLGRMRP
ncbi:hypothetical protein [Streptosporangium canum]|uniref:hypothetical protein n=1 Tax=Streptosporangium canum TaxID=324952 RepID=UPI0037B787C6